MKRYKLLSILIVCCLLWSSCSTGSNHANDKGLPKEDHAKEITIEVQDFGTNFYVNAAKKFEEETGVKVNVINDFKVGQSDEEVAANQERIQAELMAGKGADIYSDIFLDFTDIGKNNHLCNIADWVADDPGFSNDTYFMDIMKSEFDSGNVYSIPLFMYFSALGSTIEVPELNGKNLNWEDFFTLTKGTKRNGVLYGITDYRLFHRRYRERYDQFINEKNKTQNLDTPDMVKLMKQCKTWSKEGLCIPVNTDNIAEISSKVFFDEPGGGDMDLLINFRFNNPNLSNEPYFYDIPSDSDKNDKSNKISTTSFLCINSASPNKGTSWKFVKYLLSEEIQVTGQFTPVNRKAAEEHIKKNLNDTKRYFKLNIDTNKTIKECEVILDSVTQVSNYVNKTETDKIVLEEAKRFFNNEITAEAAAKNMADRVALYFKEQ